MFNKTIKRFKSLPQETKAMVFLFWVYEFSQIIKAGWLVPIQFVKIMKKN